MGAHGLRRVYSTPVGIMRSFSVCVLAVTIGCLMGVMLVDGAPTTVHDIVPEREVSEAPVAEEVEDTSEDVEEKEDHSKINAKKAKQGDKWLQEREVLWKRDSP